MGLWLRQTTGMTTTAMRFEDLSLTQRASVARVGGSTLRGNTYDHRLHKARRWHLVISADQVFGSASAARTFLEDFWAADTRELAIDAALTEPVSGWINVATEGGESPFEALDGNALLLEYTFALTEKEAT